MGDNGIILVFSADNAYNTTLLSPLSPDGPLYTIISDPGVDPGSTAFTSVTKGQQGSELARWVWRARWRGDLLTYAGTKAVKAQNWTAERGLKWKMNDDSGALEVHVAVYEYAAILIHRFVALSWQGLQSARALRELDVRYF